MPAASAAPVPPEEPPAERARSQGLRVAPNTSLSVSAFHPCSGEFVLPSTTQPFARNRATRMLSCSAGGSSAWTGEPCVVTNPAASSRSFTPIGMPASGPGSSPRATRSSIAAASARARSPSTATNALTCGFRASMRPSACDVSSRAETSFERTRPARSASDSVRKSIAADVSSGVARGRFRPDRARTRPGRTHARPKAGSGRSRRRTSRTRPRPSRSSTSTRRQMWSMFSPARGPDDHVDDHRLVHPQRREGCFAPAPFVDPKGLETEVILVPRRACGRRQTTASTRWSMP